MLKLLIKYTWFQISSLFVSFYLISDLDSNPVRAPPVPAVAPPLDVTEPVELAVDPTVEP